MIPFNPGDEVVVIVGDTPNDKAVGKTGTVYAVDEAAGLVSVRGLEWKPKELFLGERAFAPHQLSKL